jgi:hypothetical protein
MPLSSSFFVACRRLAAEVIRQPFVGLVRM